MLLKKLVYIVGLVLVWSACTNASERTVDVSAIDVSLSVERLENQLFACASYEEVLAFLEANPTLEQVYFSDFRVSREELAQQLFEAIQNPGLQSFKQSVDSVFQNINPEIVEPLEKAIKHLKYYYPDASTPRVATMVTGFMGNDLYVSDSLIIIGLDYFGGPSMRFRPDVHLYQLKRYQKEYLVPSILFFLSHDYNRIDPTDKTLLADMVWYGKGFEFVKFMAPETPDSLIIGYSEADLVRTYNSQMDIWAHFTSARLLYESAELKKQKYVGERPYTAEIGDKVPGGIGRWLGWRIVSRYMEENPEVSLNELMANGNARILLEDSGYKGQIDD